MITLTPEAKRAFQTHGNDHIRSRINLAQEGRIVERYESGLYLCEFQVATIPAKTLHLTCDASELSSHDGLLLHHLGRAS